MSPFPYFWGKKFFLRFLSVGGGRFWQEALPFSHNRRKGAQLCVEQQRGRNATRPRFLLEEDSSLPQFPDLGPMPVPSSFTPSSKTKASPDQ